MCDRGHLHGLPSLARLLRRSPRGLSHAAGFDAGAGTTARGGHAVAGRGVRVHERAVLSRQDGLRDGFWPACGRPSGDLRHHADARTAVAGPANHRDRSSRSLPPSMWPMTSLATSCRWWPTRGRWPTRFPRSRARGAARQRRDLEVRGSARATRSARGSTFRPTSSAAAT